MITLEKIRDIIRKLDDINFNFGESRKGYNPMEEFAAYVSSKEIVHSKIIAELLDPNGHHEMGSKFLSSFLDKFLKTKISDVSGIKVEREKAVPRVLTKGGDRSIDIFLEYEVIPKNEDSDKNGKKTAIIIENKLNNADYQDLQLEDYYASINNMEENGKKIYDEIKIICFHKYRNPQDADMKVEDENICVLYPGDLGIWLQESIDIMDFPKAYNIIAYSSYLKNLHFYNLMEENNKIIFNAGSELLKELMPVVQSYNSVMNNRLQFLQKEIKDSLPNSDFNYKETANRIEIWGNRYNTHHLFVVVWKSDFENWLYVAYDGQGNPDSKLIDDTGFIKTNDTDLKYQWFRPIEDKRFINPYPDVESLENMTQEIVKLLKVLEGPLD